MKPPRAVPIYAVRSVGVPRFNEPYVRVRIHQRGVGSPLVAHCYLRSDTPVWDLDGRGGLDRTRPLEDCRGHTCKVQLDALRDGPRGFTFDFILELERDYPDDLVTVQVESLQQTFNRAQNLIDSLQQNRGHR